MLMIEFSWHKPLKTRHKRARVNKVIEFERGSYFYNTWVLWRTAFFQEFYWMLSKAYLNERKYKCVGGRLY